MQRQCANEQVTVELFYADIIMGKAREQECFVVVFEIGWCYIM